MLIARGTACRSSMRKELSSSPLSSAKSMVSARRFLLASALFPSAPLNLRRRRSCLLAAPAEEPGASSRPFPWHARQEGIKHAHDSNVCGGLAACSVALRVLAKLALKMSGRSREPPAEELGATCRFRWQPAEELGATCRFPWQPGEELGATCHFPWQAAQLGRKHMQASNLSMALLSPSWQKSVPLPHCWQLGRKQKHGISSLPMREKGYNNMTQINST